MVEVQRYFIGGVQGASPAQLLIVTECVPLARWVDEAVGYTVFERAARPAKLCLESVAVIEPLFATKGQQRYFLAVEVGGESFVLAITQRYPVSKIAHVGAVPHKQSLRTAAAMCDPEV